MRYPNLSDNSSVGIDSIIDSKYDKIETVFNNLTVIEQVASEIDGTAISAETVKTKYESNNDTNVFTDAEKVKLLGLDENAASMSDADIKVAYENNLNTNSFTDIEKTKLSNLDENASAMSDSEIKISYENNSNTNAFTDAEKTAVGNISTDIATAISAGVAGVDGKSAYDIAVEEGFVGDKATWLLSLEGSDGSQGIQGEAGPAGANGLGVPLAGTTGQVLAKVSNTDNDTEWVDAATGGGASYPAGGTTDQVLAKASNNDNDVKWADAAAGGGTDLSAIGVEDADVTEFFTEQYPLYPKKVIPSYSGNIPHETSLPYPLVTATIPSALSDGYNHYRVITGGYRNIAGMVIEIGPIESAHPISYTETLVFRTTPGISESAFVDCIVSTYQYFIEGPPLYTLTIYDSQGVGTPYLTGADDNYDFEWIYVYANSDGLPGKFELSLLFESEWDNDAIPFATYPYTQLTLDLLSPQTSNPFEAVAVVYPYTDLAVDLDSLLVNPNLNLSPGYDKFGESVAISGTTCVIGVPFEDDATDADTGHITIYDLETKTSIHVANPNPTGTGAGDLFGFSVDVDSVAGIIIVGAYREENTASTTGAGAVYLFDLLGNLLHTLYSPRTTIIEQYFGYSVSISGSKCIVGSYNSTHTTQGVNGSGLAYIFDTSTGLLLQSIENPNTYGTPTDDYFGSSVAIYGSKCIVGAYGEDSAGTTYDGAAYVFSAETGGLLYTIPNPNPGILYNDQFGRAVAISAEYFAIGSPQHSTSGESKEGRVYIHNISDGTVKHVIDNPNVNTNAGDDDFGHSIAISGNNCLISARFEDIETIQDGAAYIFNISTGNLTSTILPPAWATKDVGNGYFGQSVGLYMNTCIIGAPRQKDDLNNSQSGNVFIYTEKASVTKDGKVFYTTLTDTSMSSGDYAFADCTNGSVTLTLPASPSIGDSVSIHDSKGLFSTSSCTVKSSDTIMGSASDKVLSVDNSITTFIYAVGDWRMTTTT